MKEGLDYSQFLMPGEKSISKPGYLDFDEQATEMSEVPIEHRENQETLEMVREKSRLERLGMMGDLLLSRIREHADSHPKFAKFLGEGGNHVWVLGDVKMILESLMGEEMLSGKKLEPLRRFLNLTAGTCGLLSMYLAGGSLEEVVMGNFDEAWIKGGVGLVINGISSLSTLAGNISSLDLQLGTKLAKVTSYMVEYLQSRGEELVELAANLSGKRALVSNEVDEGRVQL